MGGEQGQDVWDGCDEGQERERGEQANQASAKSLNPAVCASCGCTWPADSACAMRGFVLPRVWCVRNCPFSLARSRRPPLWEMRRHTHGTMQQKDLPIVPRMVARLGEAAKSAQEAEQNRRQVQAVKSRGRGCVCFCAPRVEVQKWEGRAQSKRRQRRAVLPVNRQKRDVIADTVPLRAGAPKICRGKRRTRKPIREGGRRREGAFLVVFLCFMRGTSPFNICHKDLPHHRTQHNSHRCMISCAAFYLLWHCHDDYLSAKHLN